MVNNKIELIDRKMVHKKLDSNVLIYNLRREIPHFLSEDDFTCILGKSGEEQRAVMNSNYLPVRTDAFPFLDKGSGVCFMLKSIIPEIHGEKAEELADTADLQDQAFFFLLYEPAEDRNMLRLFRDISEEEEKHVLKVLGTGESVIDEYTKYEISLILEETAVVEKSTVVYSSIFVNLNHDFFFEHPSDHVPGFMIIEAFRQFCVAVNHAFGNVPLSGSQLVLECLNSNFYKYAEISLPLLLKGYIKETRLNRKGSWSYLDFESDVIQNNNLVAHLRIYGNIISKDIFNRIRKTDIEKNLKQFRYMLSADFTSKFELLDMEYGKYIDADIVNLSMSGFMVQADYFLDDQIGKDYDFVFYFDPVGFIRGRCGIVWSNDGSETAGMQITEIDRENTNRLRDILVNYCHIYPRKEII